MSRPRAAGAAQSDLLGLLSRPADYVSGPQVLAELRRAIVSGRVPPGTTIPLDEVAEFFGVSRIPVREAAKTLLGEGLLEHLPRVGYTVTRLSDAELAELYVVAGALEAVALAAAVRSAGPGDHDELRAVHRRLEEAIGGTGDASGLDDPGLDAAAHDDEVLDDAAEFQRLSRDFHEVLLRPCGMPRLLHMLTIARNLTEPDQAMARIGPQAREALRDDHAAMLAAYVAGDVEEVCRLAAAHQARLTLSLAPHPPSDSPPPEC